MCSEKSRECNEHFLLISLDLWIRLDLLDTLKQLSTAVFTVSSLSFGKGLLVICL